MNCKSCKKEIDDTAKKCPYCQSFQKWFKNPQFLGLILPLIFIPIMFASSGLWFRPKFANYKKDIGSKFLSEAMYKSKLVRNYEIVNSTDKSWENISYQLVGFDKSGKVVISKSGSDYAWRVLPNSNSILSIELGEYSNIERWEFLITNLVFPRF